MPRPRALARPRCTQPFALHRRTALVAEGGPAGVAAAERLGRWIGLPLGRPDANAPSTIIVRHRPRSGPTRDVASAPPGDLDDEAFLLHVDQSRAEVEAQTASGLFYATQALAVLAGSRPIEGTKGAPLAMADEAKGRAIPCVEIRDQPRFAFRGMHLDVARHFFDRRAVERYLDLLALHRFNVFHWHLTDDQGFRLEMTKHPELTQIGGKDGFVRQDDARAIVAYARERGITVIPEIEMPGHARALLAAHPELSCTGAAKPVPRTWGIFDDVLCAGNEKTHALVTDILEETATIFPSRIVHVGGDEVPTTRWAACPKCRAAMAREKLQPAELEAFFLQRTAATLKRLGRRMGVWDEALGEPGARFGLPADAMVFAWQSVERGRLAAERGLDVVMAPYTDVYFNFHQSLVPGEPGAEGYLPWTRVRDFEPRPANLRSDVAARILGGEGTVWTEHIETPAEIETMVLPRMAILAEKLWSERPAEREDDLVARFDGTLPILDQGGVQYFIDPPVGLRPRDVFLDRLAVTLSPPSLFPQGTIRWTRDGTPPGKGSPLFGGTVWIEESASVAAILELPGGRTSLPVAAKLVKEIPRAAIAPPRTGEGALYTYSEGRFHRLPDFARIASPRRGRVRGIGLPELDDALAKKLPKENFAVLFEGFLEVPVDGVYRLSVRADDGVRVTLAGENLVEDDGEHEARERQGAIALAKGFHAVRVAYFQGTEGRELTMKLEGADGTPIPIHVVAPLP